MLKILLFLLPILGFTSEAPSHKELADQYFQNKDYSKALFYYQKEIQNDSLKRSFFKNVITSQFQLGLSYTSLDSLYWLQLDTLFLQKNKNVFRLAKQHWQQKHSPEALFFAKKALQRNPLDTSMQTIASQASLHIAQQHTNLIKQASLLEREGFPSKAIKVLHEALYYSPNDSLLYQKLKNIKQQQQQQLSDLHSQWQTTMQNKPIPQQVLFVDEALMLFPTDSLFQIKQDSLSLLYEGDLKKSLLAAQNLLRLNKNSKALVLLRKLAQVYPHHQNTQYWLRQAEYQAQNSQQKNQLDSLNGALQAALAQKDYLMSKSLFESLERLQPTSNLIEKQRKELALLQKKLNQNSRTQNLVQSIQKAQKNGNSEKAKQLIKKLLQISPQHPLGLQWKSRNKNKQKIKTQYELAQKLWKQNKYKEALKALPSSSSNNSLNKSIRKLRRQINQKLLPPTKASDPELIHEVFLEGISHYRVGEYTKALKRWQKVIKLQPSHQQALHYIENVQAKISKMGAP